MLTPKWELLLCYWNGGIKINTITSNKNYSDNLGKNLEFEVKKKKCVKKGSINPNPPVNVVPCNYWRLTCIFEEY